MVNSLWNRSSGWTWTILSFTFPTAFVATVWPWAFLFERLRQVHFYRSCCLESFDPVSWQSQHWHYRLPLCNLYCSEVKCQRSIRVSSICEWMHSFPVRMTTGMSFVSRWSHSCLVVLVVDCQCHACQRLHFLIHLSTFRHSKKPNKGLSLFKSGASRQPAIVFSSCRLLIRTCSVTRSCERSARSTGHFFW